jgi:hypothetical protein
MRDLRHWRRAEPETSTLVRSLRRKAPARCFGKPAFDIPRRLDGDPRLAGYCQWGWDANGAVGALEIRVWNAVRHSSEPKGWARFDIGERGYVRVQPSTTDGRERRGPDVEIIWIQQGRTFAVSYSVVGPGGSGEPEAQKKADQIKALLLKAVAGR